jgi:hypothetical protein
MLVQAMRFILEKKNLVHIIRQNEDQYENQNENQNEKQ